MSEDGRHTESERLFSKSLSLMPGGVNSPVRAFNSVDATPFVVRSAGGAMIKDVDGKAYLDYVMSWGPLILGHAYPTVVDAVRKAAGRGMSYGAASKYEPQLVELVRDRMLWIDKLRCVSSGTEACMTAIRIARGATQREVIVKFDGGYHGHSDAFLVRAGSGLATNNLPASAGVPASVTRTTISLPYNDTAAVQRYFDENGPSIAAVIVEPVAANMGVIPPKDGFLDLLRSLATEHGAVLIFDEVITGFRVAPGGAAGYFDIEPDLVCLGKILGGGLPIGGVGGRAELMDHLAPVGPVYQAGTLSGNPLSVAAGIATLRELADNTVYRSIAEYAEKLTAALSHSLENHSIPHQINRVESLFTLFFSETPVSNFADAQRTDHTRFGRFFRAMLGEGVFLPPSGYEAWFVSFAHGEDELRGTTDAIDRTVRKIGA